MHMDFEVREPAIAYGKKILTVEEYLRFEKESQQKHEFFEGELLRNDFSFDKPSSSCTPRFVPSNSCHSSATTTCKFSNSLG